MKQKLLALLEDAYLEIGVITNSLHESERAFSGTPERWSAKDHLAHMAEWGRRMYVNLSGEDETFFPDGGDIDQENRAIFEKYASWDWAQILVLVNEVYQGLADQVNAMSDDDLLDQRRLVWQRGRPLWRLIIGNGYIHPMIHLGYIYLDRGDRKAALRLTDDPAQKLLELDVSPDWQGTTLYNVACGYAQLDEKGRALAYLTQALSLSPLLTDFSRHDPDLANLRQEAEYQALYLSKPGSLK